MSRASMLARACLALGLLAHSARAGSLCSWTGEEGTKRLPKGWRGGLRALHSFLGCEEASARRRPTSEDFLRGLEHPAAFFRADISKGEGERLGFDVLRRTDHLEVDRVLDSGAISRWNNANVARAVRKGDRIILVNLVDGNATAMSEELRSAVNVSLRVLRPSAEDVQLLESQRKEREIKRLLASSGPPGLGAGIPEPPDSKVAVLHANNLDRFVALQPAALVMFYANWCGHCRELAPDFTKAADLVAAADLPVSVRLAKYDDGDQANRPYAASSPEKFNFTSYPSFVFFQDGKHEPFYGGGGAPEIAAVVAAKVKGLDPEVEMRKTLLKTRPMLYRPDVSAEKVLDLEPETFDDTVLKNYEGNNRVWIIEYYSDKCPFCKSLKPEYIKASEQVKKELGDRVRFAGVNSRAFHDLAERFGVTSYPWIISVYAGRKLEDMAGLGGADSVVKWAHSQFKQAWKKEPKWSKELPPWPAKGEAKAAVDGAPAPAEAASAAADAAGGTWRELLGRRTWFFLHTLAAKYPEAPTEADAAGVRHLVAALGQHYPCPLCRKHLQAKLLDPALGPVPTASRMELAEWFCRLHNMVNQDLNKTQHSCNAFELDLKYLKSCGECSASKAVDDDASAAKQETAWDFFRFLEGSGHKEGEGQNKHKKEQSEKKEKDKKEKRDKGKKGAEL